MEPSLEASTSDTRRSRPNSARKRSIHSGQRRDIQGLRAFAVIAVIADHLFAWPRGGFIGVDVFFVISGFLITGLLIREEEKTGTISFVRFYRRRAKRILPAAISVLALTIVASDAIVNSVRSASIRLDAAWALLFGANWHFRSLETDYFNANGATSPLQHYWSLSIEEQFYFLWPWLMLAIFGISARRGIASRPTHIALAGTIGAATVGSFSFAIAETAANPTGAYFSTFSRAWELGAGATLALALPLAKRIPRALRLPMMTVGLLVMVASLFVVSSDRGFPAPWALVPVVGAVIYLAAGAVPEPEPQLRFFPMTSQSANYLGDISYSLYLWHFPLIILGRQLLGDSSTDRLVILVAITSISVLAYHLIEDPIRRSTIWEMSASARRRSSTPYFPTDVRRNYRYFLLAATVAAAAAFSVLSLRSTQSPQGFDVSASASEIDQTSGVGEDRGRNPSDSDQRTPAAISSLQREIVTALRADAWDPQISESMTSSIGAEKAPPDITACSSPGPVSLDCVWGPASAKRTAVIIGDSVAMTYVAPLRQILVEKLGWRVYNFSEYGCIFTKDQTQNSNPDVMRTCGDRKAGATQAIREIRPDVVFVSNIYPGFNLKGQEVPLSLPDMETQLTSALKPIAASAGRLVFLSAPPAEKDPADCFSPKGSPADCVSRVSGEWLARFNLEASIAKNLSGTAINVAPLFCAQGLCPAFVGDTPARVDLNHMSIQYAQKIVPALRALLSSNGVIR